MASQNSPPSNFPSSMGPGARPAQPGAGPGSIIQELQDIRSTYFIKVDSDSLRLAYNFKGQQRNYDLPFTSMPITDGSRWLLYGGPRRAKVTGLFTLDLIRGAENMAGRPLMQTEAEAFAFHTGKRVKYNFFGTVVGFGAGYLYAARTWKAMKFPFIKPKPIESYDFFPAQRLPLLKGQYARIMWQITRANIYAAMSLIFAQTIFGSFGDSVMTVGLYRDQRTQEVVKAVKGGFDRIRMNRAQPGQGPPVPQQQQGFDRDPQEVDFYGNNTKGSQDFYGSNETYSGDQTFSNSATDTGSLDELNTRQTGQQQENRGDQYSTTQSSPSQGRRSDSDFFFDDASPTAGNAPDNATPKPYPSSGGGVWDSIRRGRSPPQSSMASQQQQTPGNNQQTGGWRRSSSSSGETSGDSFSFSKNDEDRQLAKVQAQKEFDAMLERERRESGSEGYASSSMAAETGSETPRPAGGSAWDRRRGSGS